MPDLTKTIQKTILLADGDGLIRASLAEYLRACDFRVIEAISADEAKQALGDRELGIEFVLTSVQLAGDGFGISHWAKTHRPDVTMAISGTPRRAVEIVGELCSNGNGSPRLAPQHLLRRIQQMQATRKPPNVA